MGTKYDMNVVMVMVPFFQSDVIRRAYANEYIFCILAHLVREYLATILYHQYKMVV